MLGSILTRSMAFQFVNQISFDVVTCEIMNPRTFNGNYLKNANKTNHMTNEGLKQLTSALMCQQIFTCLQPAYLMIGYT